jgi:hypothetical protein
MQHRCYGRMVKHCLRWQAGAGSEPHRKAMAAPAMHTNGLVVLYWVWQKIQALCLCKVG